MIRHPLSPPKAGPLSPSPARQLRAATRHLVEKPGAEATLLRRAHAMLPAE